jgi:hypothetical protein
MGFRSSVYQHASKLSWVYLARLLPCCQTVHCRGMRAELMTSPALEAVGARADRSVSWHAGESCETSRAAAPVCPPLFPQGPADAREQSGTRPRRFPSPEAGPESSGGAQALKRAQPTQGVASAQAGGERRTGCWS